MIATTIAIIAAAIASVFALGYMGTGFRQRDNRTGHAACVVAAVLAFAAVICAILSLDDAIAQHQERAVQRIEARMGDLP